MSGRMPLSSGGGSGRRAAGKLKDTLVAHVRAFGAVRGPALLAASAILRRPRTTTAELPGSDRSILLRSGTSDPQVFMEVMTFGEYDFPYPGQPRTIVDLGANVGVTVVWFAERFPEAHILAIEPDADNFRLLAENIRGYPNVTARQVAVWSKHTKLSLVDAGEGSWGYYTRPADDSHEKGAIGRSEAIASGRLVDGCTVGELLDDEGIDQVDILKVDIEGAEIEIFADTPAWITKTNTIVIELHDSLMPGTTEVFDSATKAFMTRVGHGNMVMVTR